MAEPVRFIVHNLAQAEAALRAARAARVAVILDSPPGAARYLGAPFFLALIEEARAAVPKARCNAVLDCDTGPGLALEALRVGAKAVRLKAPKDVTARVADIARQLGARVETKSARALDLGAARDPLEAARRALAKPKR